MARLYSYNGVVLPALPDWDRGAYPYAYICDLNGKIVLFLTKSQEYVDEKGTVRHPYQYGGIMYKITDGTWTKRTYVIAIMRMKWCSEDTYCSENIDNEDLRGTLYMAGSEPVPWGGGVGGGGEGGEDYPDFDEDGPNEEFSYVDDILVAVVPETAVPGSRAFYQVNVTGSGSYSRAYTVALSNQESLYTKVTDGNGSGNVWIAEDETADFVLLTATSVEEPLIQTSVMLYIDHETVVDPVATTEQLQRAFQQGCATAKVYFNKVKVVSDTILSVEQTEETPEGIPAKLKRAFWQGFMACVASLIGKGEITAQEPSEPAYIPAEYTQFDGTQYIDTGIICTQDTTIEVEFMRDVTTAHYLYGATSEDNKASVTAYLTSGSGNWRFGNTYVGQTVSKDVKCFMFADDRGVTKNGRLSKYNGTVEDFATPSTLTLGCNHTQDGKYGTSRFKGKVYSFRVFDGSQPVLEYVPAKNADGASGFYDLVTGQFKQLEPIITVPDNVLISADGYILTDKNGVYLIHEEAE